MSQKYWTIGGENGRPVLTRDMAVHPEDFTDFTEMSGLYASFIVTYGQENGLLTVKRHPVFPMLRVFPNNTHGSYQQDVSPGAVPVLYVGGRPLRERPVRFRFDGTVRCESADGALTVTRVLFPCTDRTAVGERRTVAFRETETETRR